MAAPSRHLLLALFTSLGIALAMPVRNQADCVNANLLNVVGNVYPSTHEIQRQAIQEKTTVTIAQKFEITYASTYKIVSITNKNTTETYVLYQCGTAAPNIADLGLPSGTKTFSVPLRAVDVADTTALNFMKLLGVQDRIAYVTQYAVDPCMQLLGSPQCGNRSSSNVAAGAVDATFDFYARASDPTAIMFPSTVDFGPLHSAEYIKYVSAFFNREAVANTLFTTIFNEYSELSDLVADYVGKNSASTPVVAWLYYQAAFPGYSEQIQIKFHSFRPQYTMDAGGVLPDLDQLKVTYMGSSIVKVNGAGDLVLYNLSDVATKEALEDILANVDIVIDESYVPGDAAKYTVDSFLARYRLTSPSAANLKFLRDEAVLRLDGTRTANGYTSWLEEALARPDVVLHDLVAFINPDVLLAANDTTAPRLVRSLFPSTTTTTTGGGGVTVLTADNCPSKQCGGTAIPICPAVHLDCNGKLVIATEAQPCAPTNCLNNDNNAGGGGAAGRAEVMHWMLLSLLAMAIAAVLNY
ncbi:hypothetical protein Vretimale_11165 [Volvox reticuliferus]|uniref:Uncharacterized protein n=1 Tax=Volvox reticuliferus TaxID=1737510 RepID=A0A8J4GGS6_9CHLO|nr:hypothetical protein Vretifemale_12047 [Volvox reticuliferus]GIM06927.1 hypothetical protein Vretimale_11165 [Volvox reticuliferus]